MSKAPLHPGKIVVFTGSGISAPSGIPTFRGAGGLWRNYQIHEVATPEAWERRPELVLEFYNERRTRAAQAEPNAAHRAIRDLEHRFVVTIITQNVDDLHERAGSGNVIHLHGELRKARSSLDRDLVYEIGDRPIQIGDQCAHGSQLRPHIVWFGESIMHYDEARKHVASAEKILVVGTSLVVFPAAGLIEYAHPRAEKVLVDLEMEQPPYGFRFVAGSADTAVPQIVSQWLKED